MLVRARQSIADVCVLQIAYVFDVICHFFVTVFLLITSHKAHSVFDNFLTWEFPAQSSHGDA